MNRKHLYAGFVSPLPYTSMAVFSESNVRFDQNRTTVSLGRHLGNRLELELGYLNQFSTDTDKLERIRTFKLNHALQVYFSLEIGHQSKERRDADSDG